MSEPTPIQSLRTKLDTTRAELAHHSEWYPLCPDSTKLVLTAVIDLITMIGMLSDRIDKMERAFNSQSDLD